MATAERRRQHLGSWENLTPEEADNRLGTFQLFLNEPERALICIHCRYALKPSSGTVSKRL